MITRKVDLVVRVDGKRTVIGEAVVDSDGDYLSVTGVVTDPKYKDFLVQEVPLSIGPFTNKTEAAPTPPLSTKGKIPKHS